MLSSKETETGKCPLCGCENSSLFMRAWTKRRLAITPRQYRLACCLECTHVYLAEWLAATDDLLYTESYYRAGSAANSVMNRIIYRLSDGWVRRHIPRNGPLLDIGCGTGDFLVRMMESGYDAYGVEPSRAACDQAEKKLGTGRAFNSTLAEVGFPVEKFSTVTLWHVLEHVADISSLLREVRRILAPQGKVLIEVPNPLSWESRFCGEHWYGFDPPFHIHHFTPARLQELLDDSGFRIIHADKWLGNFSFLLSGSLSVWQKFLRARTPPSSMPLVALPVLMAAVFALRAGAVLGAGPVTRLICEVKT